MTCHLVKPLDEFNVLRRSADGRQPRCRECCKAWYQAHRETHKKNTWRRRKDLYAIHHERLLQHFEDHPCVDCGEADVRVLEFDHRDGAEKVSSIADLLRVGRSWSVIAAEIAKCDVRWANCHRRRTAAQFPSWRHRAWLLDVPPPEVTPEERLLRLLLPSAAR